MVNDSIQQPFFFQVLVGFNGTTTINSIQIQNSRKVQFTCQLIMLLCINLFFSGFSHFLQARASTVWFLIDLNEHYHLGFDSSQELERPILISMYIFFTLCARLTIGQSDEFKLSK